MRAQKTVAVLFVLLAVSCQRPPADVSTVAYQAVDEGRSTGDCRVCLLPIEGSTCAGRGQPAEVRWKLPVAMGQAGVHVQVEHADGSRLSIGMGGMKGRLELKEPITLGDKIVVSTADGTRQLLYTRVGESTGCLVR